MVTHGKAGIHSIAGKYVLNHCYSTLFNTVLQCPYFFLDYYLIWYYLVFIHKRLCLYFHIDYLNSPKLMTYIFYIYYLSSFIWLLILTATYTCIIFNSICILHL